MSNLPPREPPDLRGRGQGQRPSGNYPPQRGGTGPLGGPPPGSLGNDFAPNQPRKLGSKGGAGDALHERRIEYLAWGTVVLLAGCAIIMLAIDTEAAANILRIVAPLTAGGILLGSGMVQRILFGYPVSLATWGTAIVATAFGSMELISLLIKQATDSEPPISTRLIVFIGLLVIITGMVIILQVFRNPNEA